MTATPAARNGFGSSVSMALDSTLRRATAHRGTSDQRVVLAGNGLVRGYGRAEQRHVVLNGVTVALEAGRRYGLAGPSGSGKSTLARILALIDAPDAGSVDVDGQRAGGAGLAVDADLRRQVQLLWQSPRAAIDPRQRLASVIDEPRRLVAGGRQRSLSPASVDVVAAQVGLTPDLLGRRPREVSDGQLQRACLARALACDPKVIIADEPTSMLDVSTQASLLAVLDQQVDDGMTVLLISHDITLLEFWCDQVVHIDELPSR